MTWELIEPGVPEKIVLRHLMELYSYDFSEIESDDVDQHGLYGYNYLDHYWTEPGRYPFLFRVDGRWAGFALVRQMSYFEEVTEPAFAMAEFFVMRRYRRAGLGTWAARELFLRFPGRWEVAELPSNVAAQAFWRRVIAEHTNNDFQEHYLDDERWHGPVQIFRST